jgi:hypothetical protein
MTEKIFGIVADLELLQPFVIFTLHAPPDNKEKAP